ncbi:Protein patched [Eumeta japonica]|uniref:Protein patched n=1 Tax=Eumeta variegata TaxID=151549 RepID=A0A4C1TC83_EUMVA|nr:Protein patched [Eumeta japonica]
MLQEPSNCSALPYIRHTTTREIDFSNVIRVKVFIALIGNIEGRRTSLWVRAWLQEQLFVLGCFLQGDAGKVLFVAVLVLSTFCVGLKSAQIHSRVDQLWVQEVSTDASVCTLRASHALRSAYAVLI